MNKLLLPAVLILAGLLRIVGLDTLPPGFTPDEAAFAYNAWSLEQTGRDEWGMPAWELPVKNLRSFGDYKLPLYAFLTVPSVKILGLTHTAARLPNALLGTAAVVMIYLLTRRLFPNRPRAALLAALVLAISPWHIGLSRGAFEANLVTFFLPAGIYSFLAGLPVASAFLLAANFYSYHSARYLTVFLLGVLWVYSRRRFGTWFHRTTLVTLVVWALLALPGLAGMVTGNARVADVAIFSPTDNWEVVSDRRFTARLNGLPDSVARIFSNKVVFVAQVFADNYLSYFTWPFLFTRGAGEGTYGLLPGRPLFSLMFLPLLGVFVWSLIRRPRISALLLVVMLLAAPLPAALTKGPGFAANRAAAMIPFLAVMIGVGWDQLLELLRRWGKSAALLTGVVAIVSVLFFLENYIYHAPKEIGRAMLFGRREALARFLPIAEEFDQVIISRSLSEPHMYLAFYDQIPPAEYQKESAAWADFQDKGFKFLDQYDGYRLGKFRFAGIHPRDVSRDILLLGLPQEFPENYPLYFQIFSPDGQPALSAARGTK